MAGRNMNIYFREETYSKIKDLVAKREISRFINEAVEEKLQQKQHQQKKELKQKLVAGYQSRSKNEKLRKALRTYGEISWEDLSTKLTGRRKNAKHSPLWGNLIIKKSGTNQRAGKRLPSSLNN